MHMIFHQAIGMYVAVWRQWYAMPIHRGYEPLEYLDELVAVNIIDKYCPFVDAS